MRVAVIVAVRDPRSSDAGTWGDAVAWLSGALRGLGFRVTVVDGADDAEAELGRALEGISACDALLVHVSGRLARKGVLRMAGGRWLALRAVGDALAGQAATDVSVIAELLHEDDADDALVAADHVATAVSALGARERGYAAVVAVRAASATVDALAFTRLLASAAHEAPSDGTSLSSVYERVRAMSDGRQVVAQSLTLVRGRSDLDLAAPRPSPEGLAEQISDATDAQDWPRVLELRRARLRTLTQPRARVRELVAIARVLQAELGDAHGAIGALEAARVIDPRRPGILQALRRGYETVGRWASALEVLGALVDLGESPAERAALRFAQARIALEHLQEEERAAAWLEAALADDPGHEQARALLTELRAARDSVEVPTGKYVARQAAAAVALEPPPEPSPQRTGARIEAAAHARAFDVRRQSGHTDAAFLSALALEELGAAAVDHRVLIEQLRTVAPVRARGTLDQAAWALLRAPGSDEVLDDLFAAVARAAITARVEQLAAAGRLVALDATRRLEAQSTASVVRSFQWAARVLGVACPELFVVDEVPGDIAAVRAHEPSTAVGPSIVRGRSAKDLAFLAGRHLTYYRPEAHVLVYFPTREELTRLLLATVQIVSSEEDDGDDVQGRAIAALCARIDRELRDDERAGVVEAVHRLQARGGRAGLGKWTRSIELTAARAGLFLCGDLATAIGIVRTEVRGIAGLSTDAKRRDLVSFCASDEHAALRARFVVTAPESTPPARYLPTSFSSSSRLCL